MAAVHRSISCFSFVAGALLCAVVDRCDLKDCTDRSTVSTAVTDLLLGAAPQGSVDGVGGDVRPVDVAISGIPVQRHSVAHISQRDDIIRHVLCVEADSSDVRPSGKKQELVKT